MTNFGFSDDPFTQGAVVVDSFAFLDSNKSIASNTTSTTQSTMSSSKSGSSKDPSSKKSKDPSSKKNKDPSKKRSSSKEPSKKKTSSKDPSKQTSSKSNRKEKDPTKHTSSKSTSNEKDPTKQTSSKSTSKEKDKTRKKSSKNEKSRCKSDTSVNYLDELISGEDGPKPRQRLRQHGEARTGSEDAPVQKEETSVDERSAPRQRLRARRRASVSTPANISEDERLSTEPFFEEPANARRAPRGYNSADNIGIGTESNGAAPQPRRRARRSSAVGMMGAAATAGPVASQVFSSDELNRSFGAFSLESAGPPSCAGQYGYSATDQSQQPDYGYGDQNQNDYGYGNQGAGFNNSSSSGDAFASDFGSFGEGGPGGRERHSVNESNGNVHGSREDLGDEDPVAADRQRKLMNDINDFGPSSNAATNSGNNNFIVPIAEATQPQQSAAAGDRRPNRRASLTFGFQNHQSLEADEQKEKSKTSFFKDRSGDKGATSKKPARTKSNDKLTGYNLDRDRRRFLG